MSRIRSKNTKPERIMFKELRARGLKFKKHYKLLGSPDIVFVKEKIAIFIDGDFWHGREFVKRKLSLPAYWINKIKRNMNRDKEYRGKLKEYGWKIIRLWENKILKNPKACAEKIYIELSRQKGAVDKKNYLG